MERQVMPEVHLFPKLEAVGRFLGSLVRHLPESGYPSERGAAAMLDRELNPGEVGAVPTLFDYQAYEHPTMTVPSVDGRDL